MQAEDQSGINWTVENPEDVEELDRIIDGYLAFRPDTMDQLDSLLKSHEVPMAICFRGYLLKMGSDPRLTPAVQRCLDQLRCKTLNTRELAHVDVLEAWMKHQNEEALNRIEAILDEYPRDILAFRVAHNLHFFTGDARAMLDAVERRLGNWNQNDPYFGYILGMHSFGLEEAAEYRKAEIVARRACEINPGDTWAGHAMAHVFHMQGRWIDGLEWMENMMPHWTNGNNFIFHMYWHKALYYLGRSDCEAALAIYDAHLEDALNDDFYLDACNAASLLWRINMSGINTPDRWQRLHELSISRIMDDELVFSTLHYLMAPAVLQDKPGVDKALTHFSDWSRRSTTQGEVCRKVGSDLAQAIVDLGRGDKTGAATLAKVRGDVKLIGGSWAQRELFKDLQAYYQESATG